VFLTFINYYKHSPNKYQRDLKGDRTESLLFHAEKVENLEKRIRDEDHQADVVVARREE